MHDHLHLPCISRASHLHLGCISGASRQEHAVHDHYHRHTEIVDQAFLREADYQVPLTHTQVCTRACFRLPSAPHPHPGVRTCTCHAPAIHIRHAYAHVRASTCSYVHVACARACAQREHYQLIFELNDVSGHGHLKIAELADFMDSLGHGVRRPRAFTHLPACIHTPWTRSATA